MKKLTCIVLVELLAAILMINTACTANNESSDAGISTESKSQVSSQDTTQVTTETTSELPSESSSGEESSSLVEATWDENSSVEEVFLASCQNQGIGLRIDDFDDFRRYWSEPVTFIVVLVYETEADAETHYYEVLDYGGWYEADEVVRTIHDEGEHYKYDAVYSKLPEGETVLFVVAYKDECSFYFESWNAEEVKVAEQFCEDLGFDLSL